MSTKIHNGYRLRGLDRWTDFSAVMDRVHKASTQVFEYVEERAIRHALREAYALSDNAACGLPDGKEKRGHIFLDVLEEFSKLEQTAKSKTYADAQSTLDLRCDAVILPSPDQGELLVMLFVEDPALESVAAKALGLDPYPYWDNTDRPQGMSEHDWKARGKVWDDALARSPLISAPANNGLTVDLSNVHLVTPTDDLLLAYRPSYEDRVKRVAMKAYHDERFAIELAKEGATAGRAMVDVAEHSRTDEGKARIAELRETLGPRLPEDYVETYLAPDSKSEDQEQSEGGFDPSSPA